MNLSRSVDKTHLNSQIWKQPSLNKVDVDSALGYISLVEDLQRNNRAQIRFVE